MLDALIRWSIRQRGLVLFASVALLLGGVWAMRTTPLDAIPDMSDVQVKRAYLAQAP